MGTTKVNESQIYAVVAGILGTWADVEQPVLDIPTSKVRDGGKPEETTFGRKSYSDLTVSRPYDSARDPAIVKYLMALPVGWKTTVAVHTCDPNDVILSTQTWRVLLKTVTPPRGNALSTTNSSVTLVFSVDGPA